MWERGRRQFVCMCMCVCGVSMTHYSINHSILMMYLCFCHQQPNIPKTFDYSCQILASSTTGTSNNADHISIPYFKATRGSQTLYTSQYTVAHGDQNTHTTSTITFIDRFASITILASVRRLDAPTGDSSRCNFIVLFRAEFCHTTALLPSRFR